MAPVPVLRIKILALLEERGPMSTLELAKHFDRSDVTIRATMSKTAQLKLIRIYRWEGQIPFWGIADGKPSVKRVTLREQILELLSKRPMTRVQLANALGHGVRVISAELEILREFRAVHITDHVRHGGTRGPMRQMFDAGPGKDDVHPPKTSASVRCKLYRQRLKAQAYRTKENTEGRRQ